MRKQVINTNKGKAFKFKVEYILPFEEIYKRMCREINVFDTTIPVTRQEVFEICEKQIKNGTGIDWDADEEDELLNRLKFLFPELQ